MLRTGGVRGAAEYTYNPPCGGVDRGEALDVRGDVRGDRSLCGVPSAAGAVWARDTFSVGDDGDCTTSVLGDSIGLVTSVAVTAAPAFARGDLTEVFSALGAVRARDESLGGDRVTFVVEAVPADPR